MKVRNLADLYQLPTLDWAKIQAGLEEPLTQAPD
jgi:hypothetical protein